MTLEEKKKQLVKKLDILSEKELNYLLNFIEELSNQKKGNEYIDDKIFDSLLENDLEEYKEVWKKLA
ncbi:hypothetical protein Fleli_3790 [Bernardetia litoralis DSM 6794]|uniref:Uncharacterized protein n=1 Tax=Bernardetia litoralis (strain ATCC 23117 / DSM 6794 / NBRC 15988 / NCIMB 1366 / Fx l1 / Sio-4) TaxID=880071 RepID=I4AQ65_BERLS|nr:hypothetical protein [Bernardetia litoralis]AFM06100.1 hypothetical protein Fleli_3790 [Bernardetia litoralis DSM 6794]